MKKHLVLFRYLLLAAAGVIILFPGSMANAQEGVDKYIGVASKKQSHRITTKEELFEFLKRQYLNKSASNDTPIISRSDNVQFALARILTDDYDVHCDPAHGNLLPANHYIAGSVLSSMNFIIEVQYGNKTAKNQLAFQMKTIDNHCKDIDELNKVKEFLDEFVTESEEWHQIVLSAREKKAAADARAKEVQAAADARVKKEKEAAYAKHIDEVRKGTVSEIKNFNDALIFYDAQNGTSLAMHPRVQPDNKLYGISGVILERAEHDGDMLIIRLSYSRYYAFVTHALAIEHNHGDIKNLRIGMPLNIIGKYIGNEDYTTVGGETRTAVVFKAVYLSQ